MSSPAEATPPTAAVRVFVGCDPNDCDLEQMMVLEHSLRLHSSLPIELTWMRLSRDRRSPFLSDASAGAGWRTERWATPFSGFRWAVPALCGYAGRAIYMDTDISHGPSYGDTLTWNEKIRPSIDVQLVHAQTDLDLPKFGKMFVELMSAPTPRPTGGN